MFTVNSHLFRILKPSFCLFYVLPLGRLNECCHLFCILKPSFCLFILFLLDRCLLYLVMFCLFRLHISVLSGYLSGSLKVGCTCLYTDFCSLISVRKHPRSSGSLLIGKYGEKLLHNAVITCLPFSRITGQNLYRKHCCFFLLCFIVFLLLFLLLRPEASLRDPRDVKIQELTNSANRKILKEFLFH